MGNRYLHPTNSIQSWRQCVLLVLSLAALAGNSACTDTGVIAAIEDAESLADGNLSNYIFVHSMAQIGTTVYLGSKVVWKKTQSSGDWSKVNLPSDLDTDETPVVSIAADDTRLFVASSEKVYVLDGNSWTDVLDRSSQGFTFYSLRSARDQVLVVDKSNTIYHYTMGMGWGTELMTSTKMNAFAWVPGRYYLASGENLKEATTIVGLATAANMTGMPNGADQITSLQRYRTNLYMLAGGALYAYDGTTWSNKGSNFATNISLGLVGDKLLVGRQKNGYQIYDLASDSWKSSTSSDGFTDTDSLVTLPSGSTIMDLSLGVFLFYDDADDSNDRVYATTQSSNGVFGAKRSGALWFWGLE